MDALVAIPYAGTTSKIVILGEGQNWHCAYCGVIMLLDVPHHHPERATVDHVVPKAAGGQPIWDNEIAACHMCNESRGCMWAYVYFQWVQTCGRKGASRRATKRRRKIVSDRRLAKFQPITTIVLKGEPSTR